jgi:hypothetical protein
VTLGLSGVIPWKAVLNDRNDKRLRTAKFLSGIQIGTGFRSSSFISHDL